MSNKKNITVVFYEPLGHVEEEKFLQTIMQIKGVKEVWEHPEGEGEIHTEYQRTDEYVEYNAHIHCRGCGRAIPISEVR